MSGAVRGHLQDVNQILLQQGPHLTAAQDVSSRSKHHRWRQLGIPTCHVSFRHGHVITAGALIIMLYIRGMSLVLCHVCMCLIISHDLLRV